MTLRRIMMWRQPLAVSRELNCLHQEFASAEVRVAQWVQRTLVLGTVAAFALVCWWGWDSRVLEEEADMYERSALRTEQATQEFAERMRQDRLAFSQEQVATIREQVAFANQLSEKRGFSWTTLLSDLESTLPPHVALATIKLNFQESAIVLEGTAVRLQDVNRFVTQLHAHPAFRQAVLDRHETRRERDEEHAAGDVPIEFALSVRYHPPL